MITYTSEIDMNTVTIRLQEYIDLTERVKALEGLLENGNYVYEISNYPRFTRGYTKDILVKQQQDEINRLKKIIEDLKHEKSKRNKKFWF